MKLVEIFSSRVVKIFAVGMVFIFSISELFLMVPKTGTTITNNPSIQSSVSSNVTSNLYKEVSTNTVNQLTMMSGTAKEHKLPWSININTEKKDILNKFSVISHSNYFTGLISQLGVSSFSTGLAHNYVSNVTNAYFSLTWYTSTNVHVVSWNVSTDTEVISAPVVTVYPIFYSTVSQGTNSSSSETSYVSSSVLSSGNWAGYEFYDGNSITSAAANFNVATITMPPSTQVNSSVNQVASVWVGLSNSAGGNGGLAQTGYATDATPGSNSFNYNLWYEVYDLGTPVSMPMTNYGGNPTASPGNIIDATVQQNGNSWDFEIYNYNNSQTYTASHSMVYFFFFNYQFNANFNQYIVEVYKSGTVIQQIAQFNPAINFEGATMYSNGATQFITNLYNSSNYNEYVLYQNPYSPNIYAHYIMQFGTYDTSLYGYSGNSWSNSYDY